MMGLSLRTCTPWYGAPKSLGSLVLSDTFVSIRRVQTGFGAIPIISV